MAYYLDFEKNRSSFAHRGRNIFAVVVCAFLAVFFVVGIGAQNAALSFSHGSVVAFADEDEDAVKDAIKDKAKEFIVPEEKGEEGSGRSFLGTLDKAGEHEEDVDFGYLVRRVFFPGYMNQTSDSAQNPKESNCSVNAPGADTPYYHNCDVPNLMTEILQVFAAIAVSTGPYGAEVHSAVGSTIGGSNFGLPDTDTLPGGGPSLDPNARTSKFTGLELFGYNLSYTSYLGEWDNIHVLTSARMLANYGSDEKMALGAKMVFKGIATAVTATIDAAKQAAEGVVDSISSGDITGAFISVGKFFVDVRKVKEKSISAMIKSALDTSDQNVLDQWAWFRSNYSRTLYNARELTQREASAKMMQVFYKHLLETMPEAAQVPADLAGIKSPPEKPKEAQPKCVYRSGSSNKTTVADEAKCKTLAGSSGSTATKVSSESAVSSAGQYFWSKDGSAKEQTLAQWFEENKSRFETANKYNMGIDTSNTDESQKDKISNAIISEWSTKWEKAATEAISSGQTELTKKWADEFTKQGGLTSKITAEENINAPWNRFVCTDKNGADMKNGDDFVYLLDSSGNLNSACGKVRPPIQNGFFGNGYPNQSEPGQDTRRTAINQSFLLSVIPINRMNIISNINLGISTHMTMFSNEIMKWSFSPLLKETGLDDIIVNVIEYLRDGIFFPLIVVMLAAGALYVLWKAGTTRDYRQQFITLLTIVGVAFVGIVMFTSPKGLLKVVDEIPAQAEQAVVGIIFAAGDNSSDGLCLASDGPADSQMEGLDGGTVSYNVSAGTRTLMCENWRTFAFNPWVYGQFGVPYGKLYSAESGKPNRLKNTNGDLVGDASVVMGSGVSEKNWALYQMYTKTSGTAYQDDPSRPTGAVSRDFYRLVDLQAGPHNAEGRDTRFFSMWSGMDSGRTGVSLMGAIVSIFGAVAVTLYSISKIQVTFVCSLLLVIAPIMFLIGILPNVGTGKLKGYLGGILSLMIQRVVLILMLSVMFKVVASSSDVSDSYFLAALFSIGVCLFFIMNRKMFLDFVMSAVSAKMGQPIGEQFMKNPMKFAKENMPTPRRTSFIGNKVAEAKVAAKSAVAGAAAGALMGQNVFKSAKESVDVNTGLLRNRQRRQGFGMAQSTLNSYQAGRRVGRNEFNSDDRNFEMQKSLSKRTPEYMEYERELDNYYRNTVEETVDGRKVRVDKDGQVVEPPAMPERITKTVSPRNIRKLVKTEERIERKEKAAYGDEHVFKRMKLDDSIEEARKAMGEDSEKYEDGALERRKASSSSRQMYKQAARDLKEYEKLVDRQIEQDRRAADRSRGDGK